MKKNKKEIIKRQVKARDKIRRKRQIRLTSLTPKIVERPPISQMDAPRGFMAVSSSQALMEYAKPLMELNSGNLDDLNQKMEVALSLWNLAISRQKKDEREYPRWLERVKASVEKILKLAGEERDRYIEKMIERQIHLFPEEMQPPLPSMFMYMRKDVSYLIPPFDSSRIRFRVDTVVPPDEKDIQLIGKIETLDDHILRGSDYDAYEKLALSIEDESKTRFREWLIAKGFEDDPEQYVHCPEIYLTFLYRYLHDDPVMLRSVPSRYIIEFFDDYLLRKVICDPFEYLYWPPSLKLFYRFLEEKDYLSANEAAFIIGNLEAMETHFREILQERYT